MAYYLLLTNGNHKAWESKTSCCLATKTRGDQKNIAVPNKSLKSSTIIASGFHALSGVYYYEIYVYIYVYIIEPFSAISSTRRVFAEV